VDDLIDAVHAKNSNKLAVVDVSNLAVYKNAAHFHARDKEGPLEEDAELGNVGKSKKDALIVLVPSPSGMNPCFLGQIRSILTFHAVSPMEVDEPEVPPFDPSLYKVEFPSLDFYPGEDRVTLQGRDETLFDINLIFKTVPEKFRPIIISTSRGMGKTFLLKAVGSQRVPGHLKNKRIQAALDTGRIVSFDFSLKGAPSNEAEAEAFPKRLLIFSLCFLFKGTVVDGIHFEKINTIPEVAHYVGAQQKFRKWVSRCQGMTTKEMTKEYIRLTKLAFSSPSDDPPVFLFDEVQHLCEPTSVKSVGAPAKFHTLLTLMLRELVLVVPRPLCICAGTSDGSILNVTDTSTIKPEILSLRTLARQTECVAFWEEMTDYRNEMNGTTVDFDYQTRDTADFELFESLLYASYQVPRLLSLAHQIWFDFKISDSASSNREFCLQLFETEARRNYSSMGEIWKKFTFSEMAHIVFACGVHFKAPVGTNVPGTDISWSSLTKNSLVFPYLDGCYIFPFDLLWKSVDDDLFKRKFDAECGRLVRNLKVDNLFMPYTSICRESIYNIGIRFESFFASSLAVKYYLCSLHPQASVPANFSDIYDMGLEQNERNKALLAPYQVDFSGGIDMPAKEVFVDSPLLPETSITHNVRSHNAHHDIILPAVKDGKRENIPVSVKASFKLPGDRDIDNQRQLSKKPKITENRVPLLIWLFLDSYDKDATLITKDVAFLNSRGCCHGLALDKFVILKSLKLREAEHSRKAAATPTDQK
jgi:hypothetical protein